MGMRKVLAVALGASMVAPAAGPAVARSVYDEAWAWCVGADGATTAHRVEGCTWLIRHGDQKGKDLASAFINLGQARHTPANPAVALASYERAIQLDPQGPQGYASRGFLRRQQGDNAGALEDWSQVIHLEPRAGQAYDTRGLIRAEQGDLIGAIADYTAALRWTPRATQVLVHRGQARFETRDLKGALADYNRSIALGPRARTRWKAAASCASPPATCSAPAPTSTACSTRTPTPLRRSATAASRASASTTAAPPRTATPASRRPCPKRRGRTRRAAGCASWRATSRRGADIGEALRRDPRNAATVHLRGLLRARMGDTTGAAADMRSAREMQPQVETRVTEIFGAGMGR
jgi:tetratricopeptide (TPR) repeat protein